MLRVKVLGPGCANCARLEATTIEALEELGIEATFEHVKDRAEFARYGLMMTPGLVINEKLVCGGRVPAKDEVMGLITESIPTDAD